MDWADNGPAALDKQPVKQSKEECTAQNKFNRGKISETLMPQICETGLARGAINVFTVGERFYREVSVAEQLEFFPIQSPCRGICQVDERGYCRGCMRTRDERFNWQNFSDTQKQEVLRLCRQRLLRKIRANKAGETEEPQQPSLF
ncbi:hypothetical protein L1887_44852 [Cichorium endivia]|nr:hypothetical protein L1887_44852 [Cichorium endivia]